MAYLVHTVPLVPPLDDKSDRLLANLQRNGERLKFFLSMLCHFENCVIPHGDFFVDNIHNLVRKHLQSGQKI